MRQKKLHGLLWAWSVWLCAWPAHAQDDPYGEPAAHSGGDEVIEDPELGAASGASGGGDEVISDPELGGAAKAPPPAADSSMGPAPPPASEVHFVLHLRGNRDLSRDDAREEIWESTALLSMDATLRRSESLRFGLGVMARYHFASLERSLPDVSARRYELDAIPTAAYIDGSLASAGLHVRAGYQPVALGRFDLFSAINVLSAADLRDGPAVIPGLPEIGQLGLKLDYSPGGWFSLQAVYLPFFMPHLLNVFDTDYAIFPGNQQNTDAGFAALAELLPPEELQAALRTQLTPGGRDRIAAGALAAFTPAPNILNPQGALRATARAGFGEVSLTAATALEHLPSFRLSDDTIAAISSGEPSDQFDANAIGVEYQRFAVVSLDTGIDLAPFTLGFEFAYQFHRTLYAAGTAYQGDALAIPIPGYSDMIQAGARIEYIESSDLIVAAEAFGSYAVALPDNPQRGWMFFESGRFFRGVGGVVGYATDFGLRLQLAAAWLSGPTVAIAPRISYDVIDQLQLEVGAFIIEGQAPPLFATPILSLGGAFNGVDHVFVGLRCTL